MLIINCFGIFFLGITTLSSSESLFQDEEFPLRLAYYPYEKEGFRVDQIKQYAGKEWHFQILGTYMVSICRG